MAVNLTIDGIQVSVKGGSTVMDAVQQCGVFVPHFCYHPKLSIAANCRMCMVDVEKAPKALPACATPVADGMVIRTNSERAKTAQQNVMEFLLINHPLDCPICDQGGECQLQDLAVGYGVSRSRYEEEKRVVFEKQLGPLISTDMTRCIHCTRCVRFGREVAGIMELGMVGRGEHAEIMPFIEKTVDSELSGNMIDVCPVGALTSKPFRYSARTWELSRKNIIATHDSWGSHLQAQVKSNAIKRIVPQKSEAIKEDWISDRDRFSYEGLYVEDRAVEPLERGNNDISLKKIAWKTAIDNFKKHLIACCDKHGADKIGFFVSPRATQEESFLLQKIARDLGCENIDSRLWQRDFSVSIKPGLGIASSDLVNLRTVLFIGADPARELPLLPAYFRQCKAKVKIGSIASIDVSHQLNLKWSMIESTNSIIEKLITMVNALGGSLPFTTIEKQKNHEEQNLFSDTSAKKTTDIDPTIVTLLESLQKNKKAAVIWLGDAVRASSQYGVILALAKVVAELCGCHIGLLSDGANGVGNAMVGAVPKKSKINTASLLRSELKGVVLFRCEPSDFAENSLVIESLKNADFSCAITSHTSEVNAVVDMVLPTADLGENEGTYVNGFGNKETFYAAVEPYKNAKPAWKILRLLGEAIHGKKYQYNSISDIHQVISKITPPKLPKDKVKYKATKSKNLTVYGGQASYGADMLVRRASALQATAISQAMKQLKLNPSDMKELKLNDGDKVQILDTSLLPLAVVADKRLAKGMIRYLPSMLSSQTTVKINKVETEQVIK